MLEYLQNNESLLWTMVFVSVVTFFLTLIIVPIILTRLPADYFSHRKKDRSAWTARHPLIQIPLLILKNTIGIILLIFGIIMLALPGQGILTMLAGFVLIDFPGKYQVERWVVERKYILRSINWVRTKAGKPELILETNLGE